MKHMLIALLVFTIACTDDDNPDILSGKAFEMKAGESRMSDDGSLEVEFTNVVSDNRCPVDAFCIVAGFGVIQTVLKSPQTDPLNLELKIGDHIFKKSPFHISIDTLGLHITLMQLDPYPDFENTSPKPYATWLSIERL